MTRTLWTAAATLGTYDIARGENVGRVLLALAITIAIVEAVSRIRARRQS